MGEEDGGGMGDHVERVQFSNWEVRREASKVMVT